MARIVLVDNRDSFVYNLVDALAGHECAVYRNTVPVEAVLDAAPDLVVLSPGPSHPRDAGNLMALVDRLHGVIPLLGICLGFQALLEQVGAEVGPCGPVHGAAVAMTLTDAGVGSPLFAGLAVDAGPDRSDVVGRRVPVARYHSLGATACPAPLVPLATTPTPVGDVVMAALAPGADGRAAAIGLQFHPESILTPGGPLILERCLALLFERTPAA